MKQLKLLAITILVITYLYPSAQQIWLKNGTWNLVPYKGVYDSSLKDGSWSDDSHNTIEDVADDRYTYIALDAGESDFLYNTAAGLLLNMPVTNNVSTQVNAVIGIFAIRNALSPSSNGITLDGTSTSTVKFKFSKQRAKDVAEPMYSMYIAGGSNKPAIRVAFQGNFQGDKFRVKFGDEDIAYVGYFDYRNTYDNPALLKDEATDITSNVPISSKIVDVFDFNMTGNSVTGMLDNTFSITDDIQRIDSDSGNSLIIHYFNSNGVWDSYNSANTQAKANAFTNLDVGKAYWMKAQSELATADSNDTTMGLITSSNSQLKKDYLKNIANGWNLLMFDDSYIRYATSGLIIHESNMSNLFFSLSRPDGANTNLNDAAYISSSENTIFTNHAKVLNAQVEAFNLLYGLNKKLRAFTSSTRNGVASVILLSDELIYVAEAIGLPTNPDLNITTLTGNDIISLVDVSSANTPAYSSRYGEYMLVARMNDLNNSEINATINILTPSITSTEGIATDLNDTNMTVNANSILSALEDSSKNTAGELKTRVNVMLIDIDASNTKVYPTNTTIVNSMNSVLIASGERFAISDNTYTKAYKYEKNGDFRISGQNSSDISMPNTVNIALLEVQFNNAQANTNVDFHHLGQDIDGNEYFSISSNQASNLDLLENESNGSTLFTEISLSSTVIPEANISFMRGAISEVYTIANLLDTRVDFNNTQILDNTTANIVNFITDINRSVSIGALSGLFKENVTPTVTDLKTNVVWSLDFPMNSLLDQMAEHNKKIDVVLTSEIGNSNSISWRTTDLTKNPNTWYGNSYDDDSLYDNDYQDIFTISSNKAYWVKVSDKTNVQGSLSRDSVLSENVTPHFDNSIDSLSNPISLTSNDVNHKLVVYFNKAFINPLDNEFYDVMAIVEGKRYHLRSSGRNFQLDIKNKEMNLMQKEAGGTPYPILIEAHDGLGNTLKESIGSHKFDIRFSKPVTPTIEYDEISELKIPNRGNLEIQTYIGYISDIQSNRVDNVLDFNETHFISRDKFKEQIGWLKDKDSDNDDGLPIILKIVAKDKDTKMFSDSISTVYAPLKFGHVLEVNSTDVDNIDTIPYSFIQKQYLTKQPINSRAKATFNGRNGINGGVQLNKQLQAINEGNKKVQFVYFPSGGKDKEDSNEISRFGGSHTMYLKVDSSDKNPIASITYIPDLAGSVFYVQYDKKLYIGRFTDTDAFSTDASAYILKGNEELNVEVLIANSIFPLATTGRYINTSASIPPQEIFNGIAPKGYYKNTQAQQPQAQQPQAQQPQAQQPQAQQPQPQAQQPASPLP